MYFRYCFLLFSTFYLSVNGRRFKYSKNFSIAVVGDSFSDGGNVYKLSNQSWPPSYDYKGEFSNGPVWVDQLYSKLNLNGVYANVAYGGATGNHKHIPGYSGGK